MRKSLGRGLVLSFLLLSCLVLFAQDPVGHGGWDSATTDGHPLFAPRTTYERLLPLAAAGDPDVQNLLGFMYFYSEGVDLDYEQAHQWFHLAAEQGNLMAQRNLGLFHSKSRPRIPDAYFDPVEANYWFSLYAAGTPGGSRLASNSYDAFLVSASKGKSRQDESEQVGKDVYVTYCAGCHGFNGISYYVHSPSFALRERMQKSDSQLSDSISRGRGIMPGWEDMLTSSQIDSLVRFIRTLAPAYESGIDHDLRITPKQYFLFRPLGETRDDWHIRQDQ